MMQALCATMQGLTKELSHGEGEAMARGEVLPGCIAAKWTA